MNDARIMYRFFIILVFVLLGTVQLSCSGANQEGKVSKGDPAPDFKTTDLNGRPVSLSTL